MGNDISVIFVILRQVKFKCHRIFSIVWKLSSYAAFRPIGDQKHVFVSPALKNKFLKQMIW